jgi:23S rRNA (guanosine2251-2'-O)-methyltransferase
MSTSKHHHKQKKPAASHPKARHKRGDAASEPKRFGGNKAHTARPERADTRQDAQPSARKSPHKSTRGLCDTHKPGAHQKEGSAGKPSETHRKNNQTAKIAGGGYWLYGIHAVMAALANPKRRITRLIASPARMAALPKTLPDGLLAEAMHGSEIDRLLEAGAVHQGIAMLVAPLQCLLLEDFLDPSQQHNPQNRPLIVLDQVTDPHNVGAILRSAAAFGAAGILLPKDHAASESAVMAKAASGALDSVKRISVTNLARGLKQLKEAGIWLLGLDGTASDTLAQHASLSPCALIMGAEGKGLRRLTAEACDKLVKLPMQPGMESLNVSNAAAISLYQLYISNPHT